MVRITHVLKWLVVVVLVLIGYVALQPSTPAASAYPTALENYDVPTAWSYECQWLQVCTEGGWCVPGTDPLEGCKLDELNPSRCVGCYI